MFLRNMLLLLFWCLLLPLVFSDKSFTIVLDTTDSMKEELDIIKVKLPSTINSVNASIGNYIIVPFKDPGLLDPIVVETPQSLIAALNGISVKGGHECPENSLEGIEKALQISNPESNIFVFTDAYPKDAYRVTSIKDLCKTTHSQVMIFLSGYCSKISTQPYYDVVKACAGAVVVFESGAVRQAFNLIKDVIQEQWTDITTFDTFDRHQQLSFPVDTFTRNVMIVVSGDHPNVDITTAEGWRPTIENTSINKHTQVIRLLEFNNGVYTLNVNARGKTSVTIYKKYQLPLLIGFSSKTPRDMKETSNRPIPGRMNYVLIDVSQGAIVLDTVEVQVMEEINRTVLVVEEKRKAAFYLTKTFVTEKSFRIWIKGYHAETYAEITGSSKIIFPQIANKNEKWVTPTVEILDPDTVSVDFKSNLLIACKVVGYPEPSISWEDESGNWLTSESFLLEIPSIYMSYVTIENVTANMTVNCKAKNSQGEDSRSIEVYVIRPFTFEVIQTPQDLTIAYGGEGKLFCEVSAYPDAETKWYHNDTEVTAFDDIKLIPEENALWISNMTLNDAGEYKCEITNDANMKSFRASVSISGIEPPKVEVDKSNVFLELGDRTNVVCRVMNGKPTPSIIWTFKSTNGFEFGDLPGGVMADGGSLRIASAEPTHKGNYKCNAINILGSSSAEITINLQYRPIISTEIYNTIMVKEGEDITLPCAVQGEPAPRVRWEMTQDDVIVTLDKRHVTGEDYTHRFNALWRDSGNYHCIAENDLGRAEKTFTVNVLVSPYIEPPKPSILAVKVGSSVVLSCNVLYGNPTPSTRWEFTGLDSSTTVLSRGNSSCTLRLSNLRPSQEGTYMCLAHNTVGTDNIKINVKVH